MPTLLAVQVGLDRIVREFDTSDSERPAVMAPWPPFRVWMVTFLIRNMVFIMATLVVSPSDDRGVWQVQAMEATWMLKSLFLGSQDKLVLVLDSDSESWNLENFYIQMDSDSFT